MDKFGEVREDLTPPESDEPKAREDLTSHVTKRAAEEASKPAPQPPPAK